MGMDWKSDTYVDMGGNWKWNWYAVDIVRDGKWKWYALNMYIDWSEKGVHWTEMCWIRKMCFVLYWVCTEDKYILNTTRSWIEYI